MAATFSHYRHNRNLNEWLFAFTAKEKPRLEKAAEHYKRVHGHQLSTSSIKEDPDVPGYWMFCGTCLEETTAALLVRFMENQFHEETSVVDSYDDSADYED
jgi:hypothetical protein